MRFIDEATITVQSGDGGRGCVSFRRERFVPRGGPNGGDGGKGGDVIFHTTSSKRTLYHLQFKKHYQAANGVGGLGNRKNGRRGKDLIIELPPGTLVRDVTLIDAAAPDADNDTTHTAANDDGLLFDLTQPNQQVVVARGGRGGKGNHHFKSSTNRTPRFAQPGEPGQSFTLKLVLKLMADVGIIGLPNAGKSTLISALSAAKPKIAAYPFTTLTPVLGVVDIPGREPVVMADIPGLIEGAHQGAGMGIQFLRHVERTRILVHLIDVDAIHPDNPLQHYHTVNEELTQYSSALAEKPQVVVLNKMDTNDAEEMASLFTKVLAGRQSVIPISAAARTGLDLLKTRIQQRLDDLNESP